jgi:hypothetical protein
MLKDDFKITVSNVNAQNVFTTAVAIPLPIGGSAVIKADCLVGDCVKPQARTESSLVLLDGLTNDSPLESPVRLHWAMYFAFALAAAVLITVAAAVAQVCMVLLRRSFSNFVCRPKCSCCFQSLL